MSKRRIMIELINKEDALDACRAEVWEGEALADINSTKPILTIPENPTNGDMIKAIFNPYKICKYEFNVHIYMTERDFEESDYQMKYDRSWWNAPYKAESEANADEASN